MVKYFSWNIIPWNALLFEKTVKQYQFSLTRITELFKHMIRRIARIQGWVFPLFSPDSNDRLSPNFHRFVIWYRSCDTRSVGLGQYCLLKGSNGFKLDLSWVHNRGIVQYETVPYWVPMRCIVEKLVHLGLMGFEKVKTILSLSIWCLGEFVP